jgi:maleate isomerase
MNWSEDGWAPSTRIGVLVPHADVGPESEFRAMLPAGIGLHASRIPFAAMRAGGEMDPKIPHGPVVSFTDPPFADDAAELLAAAPLDAIGCAFTSSAYKLGPRGEAAFMARLERRTRGIPLVSTCAAAVTALRDLGAERLALVNPPWFDTELDTLGAEYFAAQGFRVVHHGAYEIDGGPRTVTPDGLASRLTELVAVSGPDAVFVAGNGLRAVGVIERVERDTGVLVLTANQVLLRQTLRAALIPARIPGYGRLLAG